MLSDGQPANATINVSDESILLRGPLVKGLKDAIDECGEHGVDVLGVGIPPKTMSKISILSLYPSPK